MKKRKTLWLWLFFFLGVGILIYDTYDTHFAKHNEEYKNDLTIIYENAGNLLLSNIGEGNTTSLRIRVKNETNVAKKYRLRFAEVYNNVYFKDSITYSLSRNNKTVEVSSGIFPSETTTLYDGDTINVGEEIDYVITVRVHNLDELDKGKNIQSRIMLEEE